MNKKSITKNYLYNLTYQILVLILPLITAPYISRVLGAENIGIYSYTLSISAYFILFGSLGIALYGQREIAYKQENTKEITKIFFEVVFLRIITTTISLIIFYFTFVVKNNVYNIYYKVLTIEIIASCLDISWFFQGLENFKKTVFRNTLVKLISVICIFLFVKTSDDLIIYFLIYVLSAILGNISLWFYLPKYLEKINIRKINIFRHLKPTIVLFIPQIAIQIYTLLDRIMIGTIIEDKSEVGFYEQSQKIVRMALTVITSIGTVMLPRIANCFENNDKSKISVYMNKSFRVVFLLAFPMIFGILAISDSFVPVFFGEGYEKVSILLKIISPIMLFTGLSNATGIQYLLPTKRQKQYTKSVIYGAIVNVILNSCLIWKYGAIGASIGTVFAEFTVMSVQIYYIRNEFKLRNILILTKNYFISSFIMYIICIGLDNIITNNFYSTAIQILVGSISYVICLLIMKDNFVLEELKKIKNKILK